MIIRLVIKMMIMMKLKKKKSKGVDDVNRDYNTRYHGLSQNRYLLLLLRLTDNHNLLFV